MAREKLRSENFMQQLGLNEEKATVKPRKGFWRRQFQKEATRAQKYFDWIFGVILPVVCFVFDPLVFKGGGALFGTYKPFAYVLSFASVMAMSAWLIWGEKLGWFNAVLAGFFAVAGLISLGIGVVLFPFSLLGLVVIIGVLGFTPLMTAIVYLRGAFRTFQGAKPFLESKILINSFVLSAVLSLAFPAILNLKIEQTLEEMQNGDAQTIRAGARRLKYFAPLVNFDRLAQSYRYDAPAQFDERNVALAEAYQEMTGKNLDWRANVLND